VYRGKLGSVDVIIKARKEDSSAMNRMENEANWLKRLNGFGIGPELLFHGEGYLVYKFIDGVRILDFLSGCSGPLALSVVCSVLDQMLVLDMIGVNKEEMHHPVKHILVEKDGTARLIDFERCRYTQSPKNMSQFCQFITRSRMMDALSSCGVSVDWESMLSEIKTYKGLLSDKGDENGLRRSLGQIKGSLSVVP